MGLVVLIIVGVGLAALVLGLLNGSIHINTALILGGLFVVGVSLVIGGVFGRSHNRDRDVNGEIEGTLQIFSDMRSRLSWQAKMGMSDDVYRSKLAEIDRAEKEFRQTIEYGRVTDGSENYYSYRK